MACIAINESNSLRLTDLPTDTLLELLKHATIFDLVRLSRVSRAFWLLMRPYLQAFQTGWPEIKHMPQCRYGSTVPRKLADRIAHLTSFKNPYFIFRSLVQRYANVDTTPASYCMAERLNLCAQVRSASYRVNIRPAKTKSASKKASFRASAVMLRTCITRLDEYLTRMIHRVSVLHGATNTVRRLYDQVYCELDSLIRRLPGQWDPMDVCTACNSLRALAAEVSVQVLRLCRAHGIMPTIEQDSAKCRRELNEYLTGTVKNMLVCLDGSHIRLVRENVLARHTTAATSLFSAFSCDHLCACYQDVADHPITYYQSRLASRFAAEPIELGDLFA